MTISIITASYNYQDYIKETIESVINQTYTDWEMIIVDDGSKDNSVEVIKSYCEKDNRIKLYQHENGENRGLIETIKLGLEKANNDWIIFLESDDTIRPDYIEKKLEVIKKYPDVKFIYNDINMFGDEERIAEYNKNYFSKLYKQLARIKFPARIPNEFKKMNIVPTFSAVMLKKEVFDGINYDTVSQRSIDWYIWSQIAYKYDMYYLDEKLTNWRMSKVSYINKKTESDYTIAYFIKVQILNNLTGGKYKLWHYILYLLFALKMTRKKIIKIHLNKKQICLFGKWYDFNKK